MSLVNLRRNRGKGSMFDDMMNIFTNDELQILVDEFFKSPSHAHYDQIAQTDDSYVIEIPAPGANKDDIVIELLPDYLNVRISHKKEFKTGQFASDLRFSYKLGLKQIKDEDIDADYTDGVLTITIPKKFEEEESSVKRIAIK